MLRPEGVRGWGGARGEEGETTQTRNCLKIELSENSPMEEKL
ncbi:hypothetical protein BAMO111457_26695 [Bacillus mobilis]